MNSCRCFSAPTRDETLACETGPLPTIHDWTERKLVDFQRWGNRLSFAMPFARYDPALNHTGAKARAGEATDEEWWG